MYILFVYFLGIKCGDCGQRFDDYIDLMMHMENVHLNKDDDYEATVIPSSFTSNLPKPDQSSLKPAQSSSNQAKSNLESKPEELASKPVKTSVEDEDSTVVLECVKIKNNDSASLDKARLSTTPQAGSKSKSQLAKSNVCISPVATKEKDAKDAKVQSQSRFSNSNLTVIMIPNETGKQSASVAKKSTLDFAPELRSNSASAVTESTISKLQFAKPLARPEASPKSTKGPRSKSKTLTTTTLLSKDLQSTEETEGKLSAITR